MPDDPWIAFCVDSNGDSSLIEIEEFVPIILQKVELEHLLTFPVYFEEFTGRAERNLRCVSWELGPCLLWLLENEALISE